MRNKRVHITIVFIFIILAAALSFSPVLRAAENAPYVVTVYNDRNGLPTGEANTVIQTKDGYIWIGSYGGLIRYDATSFRNYSTEGKIPSSIRSLFEDSKGRLWIGTNDDGVYLYEKGKFKKIESEKGNTFSCIRDFAEGKDGTVYVATSTGIAEIKGEKLTGYEDPQIMEETVYAIAVDACDRLWAAVNNGKCLIIKKGKVMRSLASGDVFKDTQIYCLGGNREGEIYLGTDGNDLAKISFPSESLELKSLSIQYYKTGGVITHNQIEVSDSGDVLICGLQGFGVISGEGRFREFGETEKAASINNSFMDYEGNLWLASSSYGVIKYTKGCYRTPNEKAHLDNITLNAVVGGGERFYLARDDGLTICDKNWKPIKNKLTDMLTNVRIRHIICDSKGKIWMATASSYGVLCYDPATEKITSYNTKKGLISDRTRVLSELSDGRIAVGTQEGISIIQGQKVIRSYTAADGLKNLSILCMLEGEDGVLYAGSDGDGIYAIKGDSVTRYGYEQGLEEEVVLRLLADADGKGYFVSAGSGLYYWEKDTFRKLTNLKKEAGSIFDFYDRDGILWILQNSGVMAVDKKKLLQGEQADMRSYGFQYGMTGSLNANTWHYLDEEGNLYMATRSGISIFGFSGVENCLPKININDVTVDGAVYESPEILSVDPGAQRVTVDFAAVSYTDTTRMAISYHLAGFEEEETILENQKSGSISYTNLPGGDYTFYLKIYNPDSPGEKQEKKITIHKQKKLIERPWFWTLLIVLLLLLSGGIVMLFSRIKINRMRKRQREYQQIIEQSLQTFARTIDAKDKYTNGHSLRVAWYSRELARRMGLPEQEQERIYYVALLHDIGKIGIPDHILNKNGRLTEEERLEIQKHPEIGGEILKSFTALEGVCEGAKYHHERYDGTGYCEKKKGTDIPPTARIISVADTYDAMSSNRCYRNALPKETIISELEKGSGSQFDPQIVPFMLQMIEEGIVPVSLGKEEA